MVNFSRTAISQNAKRVYAVPITDISTFGAVVSAFESDTTMGFSTKTKSASTYKTRVNYSDVKNKDAGYVTIYLSDPSRLPDMVTLLAGNEAAETAAGIGGSSAEDSSEDTWMAKFSCVNIVGEAEDTFVVTIYRDYMTITGFSYDASLEAVETWADNQEALA